MRAALLLHVVIWIGILASSSLSWSPVTTSKRNYYGSSIIRRTSAPFSTSTALFDGDDSFLEKAKSKLSDLLGSDNDNDDDDAEYFRLPLDLEMERQLNVRGEPPIATLTWFKLQEDQTSQMAVEFLQERANDIVLANPWLQSGRIKQSLKGLVTGDAAELVYTPNLNEAPKIEIASTKDAQQLERHGTELPIQGSDYETTTKYTSIKERKGPLWRITVVPVYGKVGLIVSISHLVADIHVYYKLYDMLTCPDAEIGSLDMEVPYVETDDGDYSSSDDLAQFHVGGPRVWKFIHSPWLFIKGGLGILERNYWRPLAEVPLKLYSEYDEYGNLVSNMRLKRRNQGAEYWFEVDFVELGRVKESLVWEEEKRQSLLYGSDDVVVGDMAELLLDDGGFEQDGMINDSSMALTEYGSSPSSSLTRSRGGGRTSKRKLFVSTNDILSAWFFQKTRCRMGLICCNYRGKLEGHHEYLARNYWGSYALAPDQFTSPFGIRKHLQKPTASVNEFPMLAAELLGAQPLGIVSSWTVPVPSSQDLVRDERRQRFDDDEQEQQQQQQQETFVPVKSHWPLYDFASYCPANFVVLRTWWIQRPSLAEPRGRIGVYVAGDASWLVEPMEFWGMIPSFLVEFI